MMIYKDSKGNIINNFSDWENFFQSPKKIKDWKHGRSAYSLAEFMMKRGGEEKLREIVSNLLEENVNFEKAIPEFEVRFDKCKGSGRVHDLGIWGITDSGKTIFIGLEAKVDEPFGCTVQDMYLSAKIKEINGIKTEAPKRIEYLLKRNFNNVKLEHFNLKYQLLYSTVGTLDINKDTTKEDDICILLILVLKTNLYKDVLGVENYNDFEKFINCFDSLKKIENPFNFSNKLIKDAYKIEIEGKPLHVIYMYQNLESY